VNLWKWQSHPNGTLEMKATGLKDWTIQSKENHSVLSNSSYRYGRYSLVLSRKLKTEDVENDIQFRKEVKIPIAFNVWDGSSGEEGTKKAISSWFELVLEYNRSSL
jgi:DMSO reductase family type II enzyme heme b subunit